VHAVEVAYRQSAGRGHARVFETAKNLHEFDIFLIAGCARKISVHCLLVMETGYIVTQQRAKVHWALGCRHLRSKLVVVFTVTGGVF
jgi:hypothetical protein